MPGRASRSTARVPFRGERQAGGHLGHHPWENSRETQHERIWSAIFSRGQSSYHSQHLLLWSGDQGVGVSHLARCPPGRAPRWGNHIPAMHDCRGGTQAGLGTAAQSLSGKVPGRFWKGVTSPGDFPDACPCSNTGGSSPVPPCSSVFTIPSETQPIRTRR